MVTYGYSSIVGRMIVAVLLPTIVLVVSLVSASTEKWEALQATQAVRQSVAEVIHAADAVHAVQRERGASALYLASEGSVFQQEMWATRSETDHGLGQLQQSPAAVDGLPDKQRIDEPRRRLSGLVERLAVLRGRVDKRQETSATVIDRYSEMVTSLLETAAEPPHLGS